MNSHTTRARTLGLLLSIMSCLSGPIAKAGTVRAASCSLADVQAAVDSATDGDVVKVPNGSCAWSGGIQTIKQIRVEAESYTPTTGGTMNRSVTITNNAGTTPLISMITGNSYSVGVIGIRFNEGSGTGNYVRFTGSGTKPPLIGDCGFDFSLARFGNNPTNAYLAMLSLGGVIWNTYFLGNGSVNPGGSGIDANSPRSWQTASTMGQLDASGNVNLYIEDSTALNLTTFVDVDQAARVVVRHCVIDGSPIVTHGFTSGLYHGGRHIEIYDNQMQVTTKARNMAARYFWLRAGTAVITGNSAARAVDTQSYAGGSVVILNIGDNTAPSGSDGPMQPGWGHDGRTDVRDPIYVWGNTGQMGSQWGFNDSAWASVTTLNVELFVDAGPKPGWSRFTYPHPAVAAVKDGTPKPTPPGNLEAN